MQIAPLADVKAKFSQYLTDCESKGPLIITRNGKPVAVLISSGDEDELERIVLANSPRFQAPLAKSRKSIYEGKEVSARDFWKKVRRRRTKK